MVTRVWNTVQHTPGNHLVNGVHTQNVIFCSNNSVQVTDTILTDDITLNEMFSAN